MIGTIIYIVGILVLLICLMGIIFLTKNEKLNMINYKIEMCEKDIEKNLNQKEESINRLISIVERQLKISIKDFEDVKNLKSSKVDNNTRDKILTNSYVQIMKIYVDNPELNDIKSFEGMLKDVDSDEMNLISLRTLYNKSLCELNSLRNSFFNKVICKIKNYKQRDLYEGKEMNEVIEKELDNLVI